MVGRIIEKILARYGYYKNPMFGTIRNLDELEKMKKLAKVVNDRGYTVLNYAPAIGISDDPELALAIEYIGKRGYITVKGNSVFGMLSPVHESSEVRAKKRRSTFKIVED